MDNELNLTHLLRAAHLGEPVRVLYHHPCPDGFASAYCAWRVMGNKALYIPYGHSDLPDPDQLEGAHVVMCDCCYNRPQLLAARKMARSMLVLDHHKSSMDQCGDLPYCEFDMSRSGAGMAWDFFEPGAKRPLLIDCVEDRDLGLFKLPESAAFCSKLDSLRPTFEAWHAIASMGPDDSARFIREGSEMLAQFEAQARSIAETAQPCLFLGRRAFLLNAPYRFASRCGAILCARPGCEMAAIWNSADLRQAKLSMRSLAGSVCDVADIAVSLGGGGHAESSGASLPLSRLAELAIPSSWPSDFDRRAQADRG